MAPQTPAKPMRPALVSMGTVLCNSPTQSPSRALSKLSLASSAKSTRLISSGSRSRSGSPVKPSTAASRSARTSPVKGSSADSVRTPHRRSTSTASHGGLGRDVVGRSDRERTHVKSPKKHKSQPNLNRSHDRFIPQRTESDHATNMASGSDSNPPTLDLTGNLTANEHTEDLARALGIEQGKRILSFSSEPPPSASEPSALLAAYAKAPKRDVSTAPQHKRRVPTMPTRVLDAPGLIDDYYLNLLDWSCTNLVAIGLDNQVYVWNAETGAVSSLCTVTSPNNRGAAPDDEGDEYVCSLRFAEDGSYLAVGTSSGPVQIYDITTATRIRTMSGHPSRVAALSWSGAILSSGGREGGIINSDVRIAQHKVSEMRGHRAEVCGLEWRFDGSGGLSGGGQGLLASGGNDNVVNVWDGRNPNAARMTKNNHTAAVKAIAWSPWQSSLLATGGGSNDRTIHFWQTTTGARVNSLSTPSQVTSLAFNPHARELVSSHGFPDNHLTVWNYPALTKVADVNNAHETRVLHTALGPDGCTMATASSDENLKFWNIFAAPTRGKSTVASSRAAEKEAEELIQRKNHRIR